MLSFQNWSIRSKIIASFALLLCCMLGLGCFATERLLAVNSVAADIRDDILPTTRVLADLSYWTTRFRQYEATHALATSPEDKADEQKLCEASAAEIDKGLASLAALATSAEDRSVVDETAKLWADYTAMHGRFIALSQRQDAAAGALLRGEMRAAFGRFHAKMQANIDENNQAGIALAGTGAAIGGSAPSWILGVLGVAATLCLATGWALILGISRPIQAMITAMRRLAGRDTSSEIPHLDRRDEIGAMAGAVRIFKEAIVESDRLAAAQQAEQATKQARAARLADLVQGFEAQATGLVEQVAGAAAEMQSTAGAMTETAQQTSRQAEDVAAAAHQTSAGVQTVASAAEELAASVAEITRQVAQSAYQTGAASDSARRTDEVVRRLADGAGKIGNVVELINSIAGQTSLLALNATIEAARAGEVGRGFAVVASEVKSLAHQTARATEEIGAQVSDVQAATREAVEAIAGISATVTELSSIAAQIAAAVEQQGAATAEIARNAQQAASGTEQVTGTITGVSKGAGETGTAAARVLDAAAEMSRQADALSVEMQRFTAELRAA